MPSPFPGMDPFLEEQVWPEFHDKYISTLQDVLIPVLRPKYVVRMNQRVYLQYEPYDRPGPTIPDVTVLREISHERGAARGGAAVMDAPLSLPLVLPEEVKESYLEVQLRETHEVVTVIEVLSPGNKRAGSSSQKEYLSKREAVLMSRTHLVEIDLLRAGQRVATTRPLPPCDYLAIVARGNRLPMADFWPITLRQRLPIIAVPLAGKDPDVPLDLQEVFNQIYARAGYDYSINYQTALEAPLSPEDEEWVQQKLRQGISVQ